MPGRWRGVSRWGLKSPLGSNPAPVDWRCFDLGRRGVGSRVSRASRYPSFKVTDNVLGKPSLWWHFQLLVAKRRDQGTAFNIARSDDGSCLATLQHGCWLVEPEPTLNALRFSAVAFVTVFHKCRAYFSFKKII